MSIDDRAIDSAVTDGRAFFDPAARECFEYKQLEFYRSLSDGGVCILSGDGGGRLLYADDSFFKLNGYTPAEIFSRFGGKVLGIIHPGDVDTVTRATSGGYSSKEFFTVEFRIICADGSVKSILSRAKVFEIDKTPAIISLSVDITEQKRANDSAHTNRELLRIVGEQVKFTYWEFDISDRAIYKGEFSRPLFGSETIIKNVPECFISRGLVHPDDESALLKMFADIISGKDTSECVVRWVNADTGSYWWCRIACVTVLDDSGRPIKAIGTGIDVTEQKILEQRYSDETAYRELVKANTVACYHLDLTGDLCTPINLTPRFSEGSSPKTATGLFEAAYKRIPYQSERVEFRSLFNRNNLISCFSDGNLQLSLEHHYAGVDGSVIWIRSSANLLKNPINGTIDAFIYAFDIDASHSAREAFDAVIASDYDYIHRLNIDTGFYLLLARSDRSELSPELSGSNYFSDILPHINRHVHPDDRLAVLEALTASNIKRSLATDKIFDITFRLVDDTGNIRYKNLRYSYLNFEAGLVLVTRIDVTDIFVDEQLMTSRVQAALSDVSKARATLREFINGIPLGVLRIFVPDASCPEVSALTDMNDYFCDMTGYTAGELRALFAQGAFPLIHPADRQYYLSALAGLLTTTGAGQIEHDIRYLPKSGEVRYCQININSVKLDNGFDLYVSFNDVTRQRELNSSIRSALAASEQASIAKTDFLSRMSHEIRTPMNAIIGMSAIAESSYGDEQQLRYCIENINTSSRFLLSLINDILDMSRIESGKMLLQNESFEFSRFIDDVTAIIEVPAAAKGISFSVKIESGVESYYYGDTTKLQQLLINILSNAVKFTPRNGSVGLTARQRERRGDLAALEFVITDTGCGIDESYLPKLFDPFSQQDSSTTAQYGGSGLGLAICKSLAGIMNGDVTVSSTVGKGSTFTVTVLLQRAYSLKKDDRANTFSGLSVLAADSSCKLPGRLSLLSELGIKARSSASADFAKEIIAKADRPFDAILIGCSFFEGKSPADIESFICSVRGQSAVIIAADSPCDGESLRLMRSMADQFIDLPLSSLSLKSALLQSVEHRSKRRPTAEPEYYFSGYRLLLCEDHPLNTVVARKLLEGCGFEVVSVENGKLGLEAFDAQPPGYFDAILMDIRMPVMDGLQATKAIRRLPRPDAAEIPIIAMTANAFDTDSELSIRSGMNAHLAKPIEPKQLFSTLYRLIEKSGRP